MRHEQNHIQTVHKKFEKTLDLYHRPANIENKLKSQHVSCISRISINNHKQYEKNPSCHNPANSNSIQSSKILKFYSRLQQSVLKQSEKFRSQIIELRNSIKNYYHEIKRHVQKYQKQTVQQIENIQKDTLELFAQHLQKMRQIKNEQIKNQYLSKIHSGKKNQLKIQIKQFTIIQVPICRVQSFEHKNIQKILQDIKLVLVNNNEQSKINDQKLRELRRSKNQQKQNECGNMNSQDQQSQLNVSINVSQNTKKCEQQKNFEQQSTIKKQNNGGGSNNSGNINIPIQQFNSICQFSCDQQLLWNPKDVVDLNFNSNMGKFQKKQMISQIIMEQPSSCEDSLLMNDGC